jgi:hypothetical protein
MTSLLSFLLTNRSVDTNDFVHDEQAASMTRDTISQLLVAEIGYLPLSSSSSGFTYRLNPALGLVVRSSDSFGPFFTERSLTSGSLQASFGISVQTAAYDSIDGQSLRSGTLVATASSVHGAPTPFDVETVSLRLSSNIVTLSALVGLTDRLDVGVAVPYGRVTLDGERVDTYRGSPFLQASASGSSVGFGDVVLNAKYNVVRQEANGVSVGFEARLPTGNPDNLLGAGRWTITPLIIGSAESGRLAMSGEIGYGTGGISDELRYGGAVTVVASQKFTVVGEIAGRRLKSLGALTETTTPNPDLVGIDTIRLTALTEPTERVVSVLGFKWNVAGTWLVAANIRHPLTTSGLNANWVSTIVCDYAFGR